MSAGKNDGSKTIAIIGAGIVGVSTAIWLQRDGHKVVLIDGKGIGEGASFGNGGVLASCSIVPVTAPGLLRKAPGMLLDPGQPLFLKWSYLPKLVPWLIRYIGHANAADTKRIAAAMAPLVGDSLGEHQALSAGTGAEGWVKPDDYLFLYRDRAHFEGDAFGWSIRKAHGFKWEELEGPAFKSFDPAFGPEQGFAVRLGNHGRISDPGAYVKALGAHVMASGGRFIEANAESHPRGGRQGERRGGRAAKRLPAIGWCLQRASGPGRLHVSLASRCRWKANAVTIWSFGSQTSCPGRR
jgi:D-amino-acid dehydrogenase